MKTWILYIGAVLLGLASSLLLGSWGPYGSTLQILVPLIKDISLFILFPVILVLYTAGSASLLRHRDTPVLYISTILWALASTLIITIAASLPLLAAPGSLFSIPLEGTGGAIDLQSPTYESIKALAISDNAFTQLTRSTTHLLPLMVVAAIAGYSIKPNYEAIRPAYVVTNSFAEASMRLSRVFSVFFAIPVMVLSAQFFASREMLSVLAQAVPLLVLYAGITLLTILVILPLIYSLFTGFRKGNPYIILFNGLAGMIASFFFQSTLESSVTLIALAEQNNRVKKRIAGTAIPLYTILGKGGSSLLASVSITIILFSTGSVEVSIRILLLLALFTSLVSLLSSFVPKYEVVFIMMIAYLGLGAGPLTIPAILVLMLPAIQGFSAMINAAITLLGASFTSRIVSNEDPAPYQQTL